MKLKSNIIDGLHQLLSKQVAGYVIVGQDRKMALCDGFRAMISYGMVDLGVRVTE